MIILNSVANETKIGFVPHESEENQEFITHEIAKPILQGETRKESHGKDYKGVGVMRRGSRIKKHRSK